jgi:hypothetical protein
MNRADWPACLSVYGEQAVKPMLVAFGQKVG